MKKTCGLDVHKHTHISNIFGMDVIILAHDKYNKPKRKTL